MPTFRSEAQAAAIVARMEREGGLLDLRVRGYSPWRLLRFPVAVALQNLPFDAQALPRGPLLRACLRSLADLARLPGGQRYAVKSFASALRIRQGEAYEDVYFEALLQDLPGGVRLHSLNAAGYASRRPTWQGRQVDVTAVLVLGSLMARLFPLRDGMAAYEAVAQAIARELPATHFPAGRIQRMFSSFWWQSKLYAWVLGRLGVRTVFAADTGERALLAACRRRGCRFIELQHGIFTPDHPDALPAGAAQAEDTGLLLPDTVAAYGTYWGQRHAASVLGAAGRVRPAGASFIDRLRPTRQAIEGQRPPRLLLTTQGLAREELIRFLQAFLKTCPAPLALDVKLHPAYDADATPYETALGHDPRVNIVAGSADPDTYRLLCQADLHLSISSACHYDALGLGVPTIVLALPNHELVLDLVESGDASLAASGEALAALVMARDWRSVPSEVADKYYKSGFVNNLAQWMAA